MQAPFPTSSVTPAPEYRTSMDLGMEAHGYSGLDETYRHPAEGGTSDSFGRIQVQAQQQNQKQLQRQQPHSTGHDNGSEIGPSVVESQPQQPAAQFGILAPVQIPSIAQRSGQEPLFSVPGRAQAQQPSLGQSHSRPTGRLVADPPDLEAWRQRLFDVDDMIILTHDQFETYFPHVDNVYSHRSTQKYKRKPFVSHYWDCRMKGRPPGTKKSEDPSKKKRKRNARERDLCDVKIKITEYLTGVDGQLDQHPEAAAAASAASSIVGPGQRFWTIQRVNGNGGNGKGDGVAGPHKHTLARSDEIKKSSVQRHLAAQDREIKKTQKPPPIKKASKAALATAKRHSRDSELKLYAACFCPFSQRVWIALEAKGLAYQYCEMDPYRQPLPDSLVEANPRGLVPAIRHGDWASGESAVILEYLEDIDPEEPLFPADARLKAHCRLWIDHINSRIVPAFYALLQCQDVTLHNELVNRLQGHITSLVLAADEKGPLFIGSSLTLVDIHFAPFAIRLSRLLRPLRGWTDPVPGTRWHRWLDAIERNHNVQATTSSDELYVETADLVVRQHVSV